MKQFLSFKKYCIGIILILLLIVVSSFINYNHSKSTLRDLSSLEAGHAFFLLESLEENNTDFVKIQLVGDISKVFYMAEKINDLNELSLMCKYLTEENIKLYKKYYDYRDEELNEIVESGESKLINFCKKEKL